VSELLRGAVHAAMLACRRPVELRELALWLPANHQIREEIATLLRRGELVRISTHRARAHYSLRGRLGEPSCWDRGSVACRILLAEWPGEPSFDGGDWRRRIAGIFACGPHPTFDRDAYLNARVLLALLCETGAPSRHSGAVCGRSVPETVLARWAADRVAAKCLDGWLRTQASFVLRHR